MTVNPSINHISNLKIIKTNKKQLLTALALGVMMMILFIGGCRKELTSDFASVKKPDFRMDNEGPAIKKVLRQSPGIKFEVKSKTIERISPQLKAIERISNDLKEEPSNKKSKPGSITTSDATFTTYDQGTYYTCHAEVTPDGGPHDWYLINWLTGVYTYIGTTADYYIDFNVQKPSMYGNYRLWAEGPNGSGYTGYEYLGDPYSGVSVSGGMLVFDDANAAENIYNRIDAAYEAHQATLFDGFDHLSDEQMDNYALGQGYDEWLPIKEFEAYFGLSNLRQSYQAQLDAYNSNGTSTICTNPNFTFAVDDEILQTMLTTGGQLQIGEGVQTLDVSNPTVCERTVCTGTGCYDKVDEVNSDTLGSIIVEKIIRQRPRQTSNWFPAVLRAAAKGKVMIWKITGSTSRRPYSTKMKVRIYGTALDGNSNPVLNQPCGASLGAWDTGFNSYRRRWQRRQNHKWDQIPVFIPTCGLYAQYDLNSYGTFYMNR